ncbi:MAG TPA: GTP cyclohydrolase II [Thermoplasmata archaeon]|nr:GTP cyclohydrolase II [Thermoplasmata archaeon]
MAIPAETVARLEKENQDHRCPDGPEYCVRIHAIAKLPTRFGDYQVVAFQNDWDHREHAAFVHGNVVDAGEVPVRLHSECLTGDAIGSLRCDCRDQLIDSLKRIGQMERGVVLYLRQEGRGIGFANKIRAYELQDQGYDTVQANEMLGFCPDERDYAIAAHMLHSLHIGSVRVLTNNPDKIEDLKRHGVEVVDRIPVIIPPNDYDRPYLITKQRRLGHLLDLEQEEEASTEGPEARPTGGKAPSPTG